MNIGNSCDIVGEVLEPDGSIFAGDYVTRDGSDIHFVEELDGDLILVVCVVAPSQDWIKPGEKENNLTRRYQKINKHLLPFAKTEHERLKQLFPNGWVYEIY